MSKYIVIIIGFVFSLNILRAQITVSANADSVNAFIGNRVTVELKLSGDKNNKYIFPQIPDSIDKLIVINRSLIDTNYIGNSIHLKQKIYLTSFDSGLVVFPSFTFFSQQKNSMLMPIYSNSVNLTFKSVDISKMKDIQTIKPIYEAKSSKRLIIIISIVAFSIIVIIGLIYLYLSKKKNKPQIQSEISIPQINPKEFAYNELNLLNNRRLWLISEYKEHFTVLTDTVRRYIEIKYNIPAMESVSYELIDDYETRISNIQAVQLLKDIFAVSDLVKFAKYQPTDKQSIECLSAALKFVDLNEINGNTSK